MRILRFPSFRFCPIPKIENSEISESFLLLIFLEVYEIQNLKTDWKMTQKKKTLTLWSVLRRKNGNFRGFRVFDFTLYPKSKISESFILLIFLVVYETQNLKTDWKTTQNKKTLFLWCDLRRNIAISEVCEFSILPSNWNWKLGNLEKFSFTSNFYRFHYIKHGKG